MAVTTNTSNRDSYLIDVENLFDKMWTREDEDLKCKQSEVCIFRVPKFLKDLNEKAYVPQVLSLGPLHEVNRQPSTTDDKLCITDVHKMSALMRMLRRSHLLIEDVIREIKLLQEQTKDCYEERIPYKEDELAWILALDGCFILEILRAAACDLPSSESFVSIFDGKRLGSLRGFLMLRDIMLLENQVPLVVLIKLLELELGSIANAHKKLQVLYHKAISRLIPFEYNRREGESPKGVERQLKNIRSSKHLLDLLRRGIMSSFLTCEKESNNDSSYIGRFIRKLCPRSSRLPNGYVRLAEDVADENISMPSAETLLNARIKNISMPSAEILRNAGIEFERCSDEDQTGIRFEMKSWTSATATLFLPKIQIFDHTETILRNLIAYEECQAEPDNRISLYAILIDDFIESENDVGVMKKAGVIYTGIGSDKEVASLFNDLCKGITQRPNVDLDNIILHVKKHYKSKWKVLVAEFFGKYCSKPWLMISLVAAVMLLGMNLLRTVFLVVDRF